MSIFNLVPKELLEFFGAACFSARLWFSVGKKFLLFTIDEVFLSFL